MKRPSIRYGGELLLTASILLPLTAVWGWIHGVYLPSRDPSLKLGAFVGWVGLTFLTVTIAGIIWASSVGRKSAFEGVGKRVFLGFALVGDAAGFLIAAVALGEGLLGFSEVAKLYAVVIAWTAFTTAVAYALRRWGSGVAIGGALCLASLLFAAPVAAMPLVRAVGQFENPATDKVWQNRVVASIATACPLMGSLDAIRPRIQLNWATLPGMYTMSGLGQDVPMNLVTWWVCAVVYLIAASGFALIARNSP